MDDVSGLDLDTTDWLTRGELGAAVNPLFYEIGGTHVPALLTNARAIANGDTEVHTEIDGLPWMQQPFRIKRAGSAPCVRYTHG